MKAANRTIACRVDASLEIGTGHVMRCLTLAEVLRDMGATVFFVSRELPGNMIEQMEARGFPVVRLTAPDVPVPNGPPAHAAWGGVHWEQDADETRSALEETELDWLIVDHYAFDEKWEKTLRRNDMQIMVIDDLADRPHDCDLLLDQNLGRKAADYEARVPEHCKLLIGPRYALLRPEFSQLREESLKRRCTPRLGRLLITMGGMDKDNATSHVLDALRDCPLPDDLEIEVVMGGNAPWLEAVKEKVATMPWPIHVQVAIPDMAHRMAEADLAIGAAGSTSWERCCLGLPSLIMVIAENQAPAANALGISGAAVVLHPGQKLTQTLTELMVPSKLEARLKSISAVASRLVDGAGAARVAKCLVPVQ